VSIVSAAIDVGPARASARSHVPAGSVGSAQVQVPVPVPSAALDRRIRAESVVWLTTVSSDGRPHLVPLWFRWEGQTFLLFTKPEARKVRNIRTNPAVMLALGDPAADFDVLLVEGVAEVLELPACDLVPDSFFHEYAAPMANVGLSRDDFLATYSLAIRIRPTRYLGWAGRSHLVERRLESTRPPR
jgi:PPOX class probable F420-dependent enzyme